MHRTNWHAIQSSLANNSVKNVRGSTEKAIKKGGHHNILLAA